MLFHFYSDSQQLCDNCGRSGTLMHLVFTLRQLTRALDKTRHPMATGNAQTGSHTGTPRSRAAWNRSLALLLAGAVSGCVPLEAATMAPNRGVVSPAPGTDRESVVRQYGEPDSIERNDYEIDYYESGSGPKPGDRARWIGEAILLDTVSLGLLEIDTLAKRRSAQYDVYIVRYSSRGKVQSVTRTVQSYRLMEPVQ